MKLISTIQAGKILSRGRDAVRELIKSGVLSTVAEQHGKRVFFRVLEDEVRRLAESTFAERRCFRCGDLFPPISTRQSTCLDRECQKAFINHLNKKRRSTPMEKAKSAKYNALPHRVEQRKKYALANKEIVRLTSARWRNSPKGKATLKAWRSKPEVANRLKAQRSSPEKKAYMARYRRSLKGKANAIRRDRLRRSHSMLAVVAQLAAEVQDAVAQFLKENAK